ncbi:hypothetical protein [Xanthomonas arboricola]
MALHADDALAVQTDEGRRCSYSAGLFCGVTVNEVIAFLLRSSDRASDWI